MPVIQSGELQIQVTRPLNQNRMLRFALPTLLGAASDTCVDALSLQSGLVTIKNDSNLHAFSRL
jgi:hypothetical protein